MVPVYDPGGLAAAFPTVNVPPTCTCVFAGCGSTIANGDTGLEFPIFRDIDPPLLPVSVASGPLIMERIIPSGAFISKIAWKGKTPTLSGTTVPVTDLFPLLAIVTVPPLAPWVNDPKLIF